MNRILSHLVLLSVLTAAECTATTPTANAKQSADTITLRLIQTSDVHGNFFPEDFINRLESAGSLARVFAYTEAVRDSVGRDCVILLDNGDILQGQPTAYYYNFIDTASPHIASAMTNYMGFDAATIGNHDIETGHKVYDRWISQNRFPTLGANVVDTSTGEPYLTPYTVLERGGVRIAVLGLLTPGIPGWLPENLWKGLRFDDMVATASHWVPIIREKEHPDLLVGLFHSGRDSTKTISGIAENASLLVAKHVPGFDIVMMGHDHSPFVDTLLNDAGEKVAVVNPANNGRRVSDIEVKLIKNADRKISVESIIPQLASMDNVAPSAEFLAEFAAQRDSVDRFVSRRIGHIASPLTTRDAYFGPSAFIDFIHKMQLDLTGADISFAAPLSFDATIPAGDISVSDMFNLYKYENMLYTMELTGQEIKDYLEMSYDIWTNRMTSSDDHLLRFRESANADDMTHTGFQYPSYNFDSAAGIIYKVDVTRPRGEKITVISMSDGSPFELDKTYQVAVNSYRGNGGGNLLTEGAGIEPAHLSERIVNSTDKDLRYYLMQYISSHPNLDPKPLNQWRFVPENLVAPAAARDRHLLFP